MKYTKMPWGDYLDIQRVVGFVKKKSFSQNDRATRWCISAVLIGGAEVFLSASYFTKETCQEDLDEAMKTIELEGKKRF